MTKALEENALSTRAEESYELAPTASAAAVQAEVQAAIIIAKRFPRNEDLAYQKLMKACNRTSFAEDAIYSFPRGGGNVEGPSVNLARESARVWGNIEYGFTIVRDDDEERQLRGWAWDKETNMKNFSEASFKKLVQRKKDGKTVWVVPDERDLRELTNKHGAVLERNALLKSIPKDFIEDAMRASKATMKKDAEQDPDAARKRIILGFSEINVTPEMLEHKLGHPLAQCTPAEIADLRKIFASIKDGNSTWAEYVNSAAAPVSGDAPRGSGKGPETGTLKMEDLKVPPQQQEKPAADKPAEARQPEQQQLAQQKEQDSQFISIEQVAALDNLFKDFLRPPLRKNSEKLLRDYLAKQGIKDTSGFGDPALIRQDNFIDVREGALVHAKSL